MMTDVHDSKPLQGRVALVTGASRGIGRAIAVTLADAGAHVMLTARDATRLQHVRQEISEHGGIADWHAADLADEAALIELVKTTAATWGRLDILVNNAALGRFGALESTKTCTWDEIQAVNARAPFILCREAVPYLRRQSVAHIINISSVVGVKGYANQSAYSASKHALMGMSKALAREVQPDHIRVHCICPGGVDTGMVGDARPDLDRSELIAPQEVADAVLFLAAQTGNGVIDEIHIRRRTSTPWG